MSRRARMAERVHMRDITGPATLHGCGCRVPDGETWQAAKVGSRGRWQCIAHAREFWTVAEVLAAERRHE